MLIRSIMLHLIAEDKWIYFIILIILLCAMDETKHTCDLCENKKR
jgi:hypothetical protein